MSHSAFPKSVPFGKGWQRTVIEIKCCSVTFLTNVFIKTKYLFKPSNVKVLFPVTSNKELRHPIVDKSKFDVFSSGKKI